METLLQRAKKVRVDRRRRGEITSEDLELALAWVRGEITVKQVMAALGNTSPSSAYLRLALALRKHLQDQK